MRAKPRTEYYVLLSVLIATLSCGTDPSDEVFEALMEEIDEAPLIFLAGCDAIGRCSDGSRACVTELAPIVSEWEARGKVAIEWEGPGRVEGSDYYGYYWFVEQDGGGRRYFYQPGVAGDNLIMCGSYCGWHVVEEPAGAIIGSGPILTLLIPITIPEQRVEELGKCVSPLE
jgi:hypothetical protein